MESNIQSSFIPHDAGQPLNTRRPGSSGVADLALMLAILAFASAAALAVAVFIYSQYVTTTANNDLAQLKKAEQNFQPELIAQLQRLDDRMHAGETILATHSAPSVFFDILNQVTAKTIAYTNLKFDASDPQKITLDMDGVGKSVNSIAFQSDVLAKSGMFQTPIFSSLDHQPGGVHFHVKAELDPSTISFEKLTGAASASPSAPETAPAAPAAPASPFGGSAPSSQ